MESAEAGPSRPQTRSVALARQDEEYQRPPSACSSRHSPRGLRRSSIQERERHDAATRHSRHSLEERQSVSAPGWNPLMDDALRSLPTEAERRASRSARAGQNVHRWTPGNLQDVGSPDGAEAILTLRRHSSRVSESKSNTVRSDVHRRSSVATMPDDHRDVLGAIKSWVTGSAQEGADKAGKGDHERGNSKSDDTRYHRKHKKGTRRTMSGKKRAQSRLSGNSSPSGSDVIVALPDHEEKAANEVHAPINQEVPPPPDESTAHALSQAAGMNKLKRPRLHFAPQKRNIRRKDLPADYETGDVYRDLDGFVKEQRMVRRKARRSSKRRGSRGSRASTRSSRSSRASLSSAATSSASSNSSSSSASSSSSDSSASGRLTMARLRAFFGDSDSSSSSSSSSSDTNSSSDDTSNKSRSSSSSKSSASSRSFRLFRRRKASRASSDSGEGDHEIPLTPRMAPQRFQLKGGAARRRRQRALKRLRAQEKQLAREGKVAMKASRAARRKAKLAKEQAGGITEYFLFTPVALSSDTRPHQHFHRGTSYRRVDNTKHVPQAQAERGHADEGSPSKATKVLQTTSFDEVRARLHALRRYKRQRDHAEGDLGDAEVSDADILPDNANGEDEEEEHSPKQCGSQVKAKVRAQTDRQESIDFGEEGDLALPPPALDLPGDHRSVSVSSGSRTRKRQGRQQWHMSDVPLTPQVQMAQASEFSRGLEAALSDKAFSPTLETHLEASDQRQRQDEAQSAQTTPARLDQQSSEGSNQTKIASPSGALPLPSFSAVDRDAAWWLDINCPTYRDMTELSKMFPLHPLTVEDVLQQDTREKVEIFEKLGYYFVVIRAIDERYFKYTSAPAPATRQTAYSPSLWETSQASKAAEEEDGRIEMAELPQSATAEKSGLQTTNPSRHSCKDPETSSSHVERTEKSPERDAEQLSLQKPRVDIVEGLDGKEGVEGIGVGAVNLYLVVFKHGIISFHFEDVSKHTNKVRKRVVDLSQPVDLTSDWIAHGIFDSVIDAFFPLLSFVETEVDSIDRLTSEPLPSNRLEMRKARKARIIAMEGANYNEKSEGASLPMAYVRDDAYTVVFRPLPRLVAGRVAQKVLPSFCFSKRLVLSKLPQQDGPPPKPRSLIQRVFGINRRPARVSAFLSESALGQSAMLRRITETRKITTGLSRLLVPKNDSVRGLQKRLVDLRGTSISQEEMSIYMGDVQDHIVTLLAQLGSSDNRLGDIHFSYLSSIRIMNNRVSHSTDEILIVLATITITIFIIVFVISIFSLNVHIPGNLRGGPKYDAFGAVLGGVLCVPILVTLQARYWIHAARQKTVKRRANR